MEKKMTIPFNRPFLTGKEAHYIYEAVYRESHLSGNGKFTKLVHRFFEQRFGFRKVLLTTSCTDALEMTGLLLNLQPGDEVIVPSFTFVSTANAYVLRGAYIRFADSAEDNPNIDPGKIEELINERTKAIVVVHYAGVAVDMDKILDIARRHNIKVIEDAAQAIDSYYKGKPLGGIGDLGTFSFHETKNVISGEGGLLAINNPGYTRRAEIIWEKGTNRAAFFRGEVDKYGWVDVGSSFLPSELVAAFLYAQLEHLEKIQEKRRALWQRYYENLEDLQKQGLLRLPVIPEYATNNAHMFYVVAENVQVRDRLMNYLKSLGIKAVFHYLPLHLSPFYKDKHDGRELPNAVRFSETILRLPMFYELTTAQVDYISEQIRKFFGK